MTSDLSKLWLFISASEPGGNGVSPSQLSIIRLHPKYSAKAWLFRLLPLPAPPMTAMVFRAGLWGGKGPFCWALFKSENSIFNICLPFNGWFS